MKIYLWDAVEPETNSWKEITLDELKRISDIKMIAHYVATKINLEKVSDEGDLYFYRY